MKTRKEAHKKSVLENYFSDSTPSPYAPKLKFNKFHKGVVSEFNYKRARLLK